jgi:hypothetical protein
MKTVAFVIAVALAMYCLATWADVPTYDDESQGKSLPSCSTSDGTGVKMPDGSCYVAPEWK